MTRQKLVSAGSLSGFTTMSPNSTDFPKPRLLQIQASVDVHSLRQPLSLARDQKRKRVSFLLVTHEHAVHVTVGNMSFLRGRLLFSFASGALPAPASDRKCHLVLDSLDFTRLSKIMLAYRFSPLTPPVPLFCSTPRSTSLHNPLFVLSSFDSPPSFPVPAFTWVSQRPRVPLTSAIRHPAPQAHCRPLDCQNVTDLNGFVIGRASTCKTNMPLFQQMGIVWPVATCSMYDSVDPNTALLP